MCVGGAYVSMYVCVICVYVLWNAWCACTRECVSVCV